MVRETYASDDYALRQLMWIEDQLGVPIGHRKVVRTAPPQHVLQSLVRSSGGLAAQVRSALGANWFTMSQHAAMSVEDRDVCAVTRAHPRMPDAIRALADPPLGMRIRGQVGLLGQEPRVAIVGSRRPRADSASIARRIASQLAAQGVTIVSGLAVGVDTAAHRGALDSGGSTVAVLGSGLGCVYPTSNRSLAVQIVDHGGALVSEYPHEAMARPHQFAARNRIIAALADIVVVIQAREQSGSMITARRAEETNADIGVVPGWIGDPEFMGSLGLIRDGASVVTCAEDVLRMLGRAPQTTAQMHRFGTLLDAPRSVEELASLLCTSSIELFEELLELELAGLVSTTTDGRWINHGSTHSERTSPASLR